MASIFYNRNCECNDCGKKFARAFDGKKPPKLKTMRCFCPFCGGVAITVDSNAHRREL